MKNYALHGVWRYWGRTLLSSSSATWQQLFGLDKHLWAFICYLHLLIFYWAAALGGRFSNPPTTPSPIVSGYIMRHLTFLLVFFIFNNSFGQKKQCFCAKDTFMNTSVSNCETKYLSNKSKLYWQFNCDKIWLTLENKSRKKIIIDTVPTKYFGYTYRLGFHLIKEFKYGLLFRTNCAATGPCEYVLIDKYSGKKIKKFGQLICIDTDPNGEKYNFNFVVYLSDEKLNLYFVDTKKLIAVPFTKNGLMCATIENCLTNLSLKNNKVKIDYESAIDKNHLNVLQTLTIDLKKYSR